MPAFTSQTLARYFNQGEGNLSQEKPFMVDRYSFPLVAGTNVYQLPDYVSSIRRVTFNGWKIDPLPGRNFREVFQSATQRGWPFWYVFNNIGLNSIELFPGVDTNYVTVTDLWNQAGTDNILTGIVIEFARISDNSTFVVPSYFRRQLLKQWTARQCFSLEGPEQNLKLAGYFSDRWEKRKAQFFDFLADVHNKSRKLVVSDITNANYFPASPVLPIDRFGFSVETGE